MIQRRDFDRLFTESTASAEARRLALWELADVIRRRAKADEDARTEGWMLMDRKIGNYDPAKGSAFSYFYRVGRRRVIELKTRNTEIAGREVAGQATMDRVGGTRSFEPTTAKWKTKPRVGFKITDVDRMLRKFDEQVEAGGDYLLASAGVVLFQALRWELVGAYLPLKSDHIALRRTLSERSREIEA